MNSTNLPQRNESELSVYLARHDMQSRHFHYSIYHCLICFGLHVSVMRKITQLFSLASDLTRTIQGCSIVNTYRFLFYACELYFLLPVCKLMLKLSNQIKKINIFCEIFMIMSVQRLHPSLCKNQKKMSKPEENVKTRNKFSILQEFQEFHIRLIHFLLQTFLDVYSYFNLKCISFSLEF